jgi:hypothetical protein
MRKTLILATVATLALAAPALAQSAGSPGAASSGSGSNPPGSAVQPNVPHNDTGGAMKTRPMSEGRAAAPDTPTGQTAPNGNAADKAKSGANGG